MCKNGADLEKGFESFDIGLKKDIVAFIEVNIISDIYINGNVSVDTVPKD